MTAIIPGIQSSVNSPAGAYRKNCQGFISLRSSLHTTSQWAEEIRLIVIVRGNLLTEPCLFVQKPSGTYQWFLCLSGTYPPILGIRPLSGTCRETGIGAITSDIPCHQVSRQSGMNYTSDDSFNSSYCSADIILLSSVIAFSYSFS